MTEVLDGVQFREPGAAEDRLSGMLERHGFQGLPEHLPAAMCRAWDPDTALVRLERYLDASFDPAMDLRLMHEAPSYAVTLVTILDQSHYLTDILCRNSQFMLWLWQEAELDKARNRGECLEELLGQIAAFDRFEPQCQSLRRYKRREFLRIAARDIVRHKSLASVTEDLSNLADASIETALTIARPELLRRYGEPRQADGAPARFCVLALGKLGGRELNFSSDIDLLFIYSGEGETTGGESKAVSNAEYYQKLGERLIRALTEVTSEGRVFRVDMRLRPHGKLAPLAVSIEGAVAYYESVGAAWERQALIKARPAAGDMALGEEFIERVEPFVFPRYFDDDTLEAIRQIKQQTEAQTGERGETAIEVKKGHGGIRDIEFTIQMLQLLNGGRLPETRERGTLDAIHALERRALLTPFEATTLSSNYTFLRLVEHRLQIEGSQQRHTLPSDPAALDAFARRIGYESGSAFMSDYRDRTEANRSILERFLTSKGPGTRWVVNLLHPHDEGADGLRRLEALGFSEPVRAREELMRLYAGAEDRPHTQRVRQQFTAVAPKLIEELAACGNPDGALMRCSQVLARVQAPGAIYDILRISPNLCKYLVKLVVNSEYLTEILIREPGLFDVLDAAGALGEPSTKTELLETLDGLRRAYNPEAALYRLHAGETLRIGLRDLFQEAGPAQTGRELALLAEVCLEQVTNEALEAAVSRYGQTSGAFAVLGLGKLGGRELGYGSDLDLVFVYETGAENEQGMSAQEYFAWAASRIIRTLKEPTRYGSLYDIDARLRPDGKKGVLTVSAERIQDYYRQEAQPWERLALAKIRDVAGDREFGAQLAAKIQDLAFTTPLDAGALANIEDVREKITAGASPRDLKKHEGGLVELEFAVRLLQFRHAHRFPDLKRADVLGAVDTLEQNGLVTGDQAALLREGYLFYRTVENRIRMMHGRSGSEFPETEEAVLDLASRLGMEANLPEKVEEYREQVHALYLHVLQEP